MKTEILPINNMCGLEVGRARVTTNNIGKVSISPLGDDHEYKRAGVILSHCKSYVHYGLWDKSKCRHA